MLAGRAFQGVGSGVILSLVEIVLADLVSLSEWYATSNSVVVLCMYLTMTHPTSEGVASRVHLVLSGRSHLCQSELSMALSL